MKELARVLFIDQESKGPDNACRFLQRRGFSVSSIPISLRNEAILKVIEFRKTDVVVINGDLSSEKVLDFLKKLHSLRYSIPCIVVSSVISSIHKMAAFRAGAYDILRHPVSLGRLEKAIRQGLKLRERSAPVLDRPNLQEERDRLLKWNDDLGRLHRLNQSLCESLNLDEVVQSLMMNLKTIVRYDVAWLFVKSGDKVQVYSSRKRSALLLDNLSNETSRSGQAFIETGELPSGAVVLEEGAEIVVPLRVASKKVGLLRLTRNSSDVFNDYESKILGMIATSLSLAVRNAEIHRHVQELAVKDELTALLNRRAFLNAVGREFKRVVRHEMPLALVLIDIDHFKEINDRYGHLIGDQVIRDLAQVLNRSVRDVDTIARYGGDEFVIILPRTNLGEALIAAERIKKTVRTNTFNIDRRPVEITVSMGIAHCPLPQIQSPEDLFRVADQALYTAKKKGRNRIGTPPVPATLVKKETEVSTHA
ncbi:MAG: diguanylate cyclase [Nitrospirae bacterium]|nr:diguanylate cyclase [Candidatus Manganitrophaceae bacterium]